MHTGPTEMHAPLLAKRDGAATPRACHDLWAALLFAANVLCIAILAGNNPRFNVPDQDASWLIAPLLAFLFLSATGAALATGWMAVLVVNASSIIYGTIYLVIALSAMASIYALAVGSFVGALILALTCAGTYWSYLLQRPRIPFASAVLVVSVQSIQKNCIALTLCAYAVLTATLLWVVLWSIATDTVFAHHISKGDSWLKWTKVFAALLSLYWGCQLGKAVLMATVAGTLASWWFVPSQPRPVVGTFLRVVSWSLGSLCLGSLLVSIIKAAHALVQLMRAALNREASERRRFGEGENAGECLQMCLLLVLQSLLSMVEQATTYFSKYAFCYVAAYGLGFVEASSRVVRLFRDRCALLPCGSAVCQSRC